MNNNILKNNEYAKICHGIVLDGLPDITEFHFFLGSGRPETRLSSNVVFIFQKSLNVWKDVCLEAKHVGAHLMDQLKKKCVISMGGSQRGGAGAPDPFPPPPPSGEFGPPEKIFWIRACI